MSRPLARPAPHPMPARLAPVGSPAYSWLDCPQCRGTCFVEECGVSWHCDACDSNGRLELRIVPGRADWHERLYPEMREARGFFVLIDGKERELAFCRTLEDAKAGRWLYWPIEEHAEVLLALGVAPGGGR